jgi:hypothetical protein
VSGAADVFVFKIDTQSLERSQEIPCQVFCSFEFAVYTVQYNNTMKGIISLGGVPKGDVVHI